MRGNAAFHGVTNIELAPIKTRTVKKGGDDVPFYTRDIIIHGPDGTFEITLFADSASDLGVQETFL